MSTDLNNKFNMNTSIRLNKNKFIIVINQDSYEKFLNLMEKYIIPSMWYKLPKQKIILYNFPL